MLMGKISESDELMMQEKEGRNARVIILGK